MTIAQTILDQIGGANRVKAMTGAKNFVNTENGLRFDLPRNVKVHIILNGLDLYDVVTYKWNARALELKKTGTSINVDAESLKAVLESMTGLYFSL